MSWTRGPLAALAVCVLLVTGSAGCGTSGTEDERKGRSASTVGELLDDSDEQGRLYREVDADQAPEVGVEVEPNDDDSWDVRLTVRGFRFSPAGTKEHPVAGQGLAHLYLDGKLIAKLRGPAYRLPAELVPRGTHQLTARLYADDGTVWATDGEPIESTADLTASETDPSMSAGATRVRNGGQGSPDRAGKAS
ncbi:hypothetical protein Stsp02_18580 [Streptomyces sp. NBRC 14336]|uniref:hypothetical protein n=1 Tax=Streptomyces sp. NBRC 14336 TaxID=3030992 RepID=UPI0024A17849|nr:hypothetical protein [Streptomyces sp. NBRC 14336]GLW46196.1 hypothetical protein Stsp02_18580 [Streptomyces sp. NBRC 14336]